MQTPASSPIVSIIIPCFNAERYIADAIRSSLEQTYPHKEVIVIDDGSTDCSVDVIKKFEGSIVWETGPNKGACTARNRGLQLAKGERIQFLDADDWLYPQKLEIQMECVRLNPNATPICDWVLHESGKPDRPCFAPNTCMDSLPSLLSAPLLISSPLHSKEMLIGIGGFLEELPCGQDYDLNLRLACEGWPLVRIPEPLYSIRRVPGSVSSNYEKVIDQVLPMANRVSQILKQRGKLTEAYQKEIATFITRNARIYVRLGRPEKAARYFSAAIDSHPSGGWDKAYGRWTRTAAAFIGPVTLDRILAKIRPLLKKIRLCSYS